MERSGSDDGADDDALAFRAPLPPDDRLWRHPSELVWPPTSSAQGPAARGAWPVGIVSALCSSVLTIGLLAATGVLDREPRIRDVVVREAVAPAATASGRSLSVVAERASESVVRVVVSGEGPGVGSGVIVRDDGHVLTNAHVVADASRIVVHLHDGRSFDGRVVGSDPETDLALVRVEVGEPLPVAVLGSVDDVAVGDVALAVGSPMGLDGAPSVTSGIVSAVGRSVEGQDGLSLLDMIQTDAAIAPGSSGGALVDARGVVVGITTAFAVSDTGAEGLGFATPVDVARAVVADLVDHGRVRPPWLGIQGNDTVGGLGAEVEDVLMGSPAADGGIRRGDVVVAVDRRPVRTMSELRVALRRHRPGHRLAVTVTRGDDDVDLVIVLAERPRSS